MKFYPSIILLLIFSGLRLGAQLNFTSLDSVLSYAVKNSSSLKINSQQDLLAKWTKIAALGSSVNLRSPFTFSSTDNSMLPVNFIPAEVFGGPAGTFRPITLGQRYVSNFNFNPQIDIINPYAWAKVKSASVNKELTALNDLLNKRSLFESIAAAYYNAVALSEQIAVTQRHLAAADSLLSISQHKFSQGISREQDVNNMKVNQLSINDKLVQLKVMLDQQYNSLKILCDIPSSAQIRVTEPISESKSSASKVSSDLNYRFTEIQNRFARSEWRANQLAMFPVLSLVYYQGWQQNSNTGFFDSKSTWIQSRYIGLRISVPFPPDVSKLSQSYTSKVNFRIARLTSDHTKLQNELNNDNLELDLAKTLSGFETSRQIVELKKLNYEKSLNQYNEGILSGDNLLNAFGDMLVSQLNSISAASSLKYTQSRITINNSIK